MATLHCVGTVSGVTKKPAKAATVTPGLPGSPMAFAFDEEDFAIVMAAYAGNRQVDVEYDPGPPVVVVKATGL